MRIPLRSSHQRSAGKGLGMSSLLLLSIHGQSHLKARAFSTQCHHAAIFRLPRALVNSPTAAASNNNEEGQDIQQLIAQYNSGIPINIQSPKQVSMAIFGRPQSVTKAVLEQAMLDQQLPSEKRQLAHLVLQCRASLQTQLGRRRSFSTANSESEVDHPTSIPFPPKVEVVPSSTHEQMVDSLFDRPRSKLDGYWRAPLKQLSRPVARDLLKQLDPVECPMGFDPTASPKKRAVVTATAAGKKGSFLAFCREQKQLYPQCVILTRMGDFYETYGIDAILLVEHVGLNPMAGKARAGCPYRNIQATLNCLTEQGYSIAVYEEVGQTASNKLKTRVLSQIVSPASPTYLYDHSWLLGSDHDNGAALEQLPPSRPCVGIVHTAAGYHLAEVSLEERSVLFSERLTPEAVSCRLAAYPPADPLIYIPSPTETVSSSLPFLPHSVRPSTIKHQELIETHLGGFRLRTIVLPPHLIPTTAGSESDRYIQVIVETLLHWNEKRHDEGHHELTSYSRRPGASIPEQRPSPKDFTIAQATAHTQPLYMETASQLGLLQDPAIPSLIAHVLDEAAPAATRRFLKRYLLVPPPPEVANAMATIVGSLLDDSSCNAVLPRLTVPPLGKVLSLIRAGQASAAIYGELLHALAVTRYLVSSSSTHNIQVDALLTLCSHESGLLAQQESLALRCQQAIDAMETVICPSHHVDDELLSLDDQDREIFTLENPMAHYQYLPDSFVERNEMSWRGRVQRNVADKTYRKVEEAGRHLDEMIARDFINGDESNRASIVQDIFNNLLALKKIPATGKTKDYIHPRDRHGKKISNRYSTKDVEQALSDYVKACDDACEEVSTILSGLATTLQNDGHIPAIVQSAHLNLALSAAYHHAVKANKQNWHHAKIMDLALDDGANGSGSATFVGLWPYWMHKSQAVSNTFDLNGMFLLTAPNMSGKSTLMRSTAAAALLTVCGLCAPLEAGSCVPRFDTLFLRGASADVPAENKSAFGAEMEDIAALMRCCGPRSLVFVDEIGRGTSPRDGTRLAAAILEAMAVRGMSGIFATHLHDILNLPLLSKPRIITKQMAITRSTSNAAAESYEWTYRLEDGVCNDSLAMVTAARFGLPEEIIRRADELEEYLPHNEVQSPVPRGIDIASDDEDSVESTLPSNRKIRTNGSKQDQNDFHKVVQMAEETTLKPFTTIPPNAIPPPALAKQSCVYLLQLRCYPPRYYIGETDAFFQRLKSHRSKGASWSSCRAAVLPVSSKTDARRFESLLIQQIAQAGFTLESTHDGRKTR